MRIHFIAIGGAAMHNLAIALHLKGDKVTGSDDEIFDPAKSHLQQHGLLPDSFGWHPERITSDVDAVILGMHAKADNPELLRAQELHLPIYSYPQYLYEHSKNKTRIVVGGSHGKTTTTAMILHAMRHAGIETDYMVGAQLQGFDVMVRLSDTARYMVIEGDEYLTSPIDPTPKFLHYHPHIAIVTGIEWDHVNVFPTFDDYRRQFQLFAQSVEPNGAMVYCAEDPEVEQLPALAKLESRRDIPYRTPAYHLSNGTTVLDRCDGRQVALKVFGRHNLLNLTAAREVCKLIGMSGRQFDSAIATFEGASKRLERIAYYPSTAVYKDFAHAPSKLRATVAAMKEQYPDRKLVACMELHTYSSLTAAFLSNYKGCMALADRAIVYYSQHALQLKRLPPLDPEQVRQAFGTEGLEVYTDSQLLLADLNNAEWHNTNLLMMSSGNFDGIIDKIDLKL